ISDSSGGVYNPGGIEVAAARAAKRQGPLAQTQGLGDPITNEELLALPVDILVLAAMEGAIDAKNASHVRAPLIIEGANGPISRDADAILEGMGTTVVPDILANAGGVVVSYFEWVQDRQAFWWDAEEVDQRLARILSEAFQNVLATGAARSVPLRMAALLLGIGRVVEATRTRGIFP
ncbi:MAG TPA: glutamate dehydrogenase, partial [Dehalococcoidia bacterium]|nr:glutamate dehydrogenase [Dehalococcoidia bacterium]